MIEQHRKIRFEKFNLDDSIKAPFWLPKTNIRFLSPELISAVLCWVMATGFITPVPNEFHVDLKFWGGELYFAVNAEYVDGSYLKYGGFTHIRLI